MRLPKGGGVEREGGEHRPRRRGTHDKGQTRVRRSRAAASGFRAAAATTGGGMWKNPFQSRARLLVPPVYTRVYRVCLLYTGEGGFFFFCFATVDTIEPDFENKHAFL